MEYEDLIKCEFCHKEKSAETTHFVGMILDDNTETETNVPMCDDCFHDELWIG